MSPGIRTLVVVGYRVLLAVAVGAHFAFLAFAVFGGFLAWRWPRTIWLHGAGAGWLLLVVVAQLTCPLTWLEDRSREAAGLATLPAGFLDHYVEGVFYPRGAAAEAQIVVALIVLTSWIGYAVRTRRRRVPVV
jgi:hypothetical protein